MKGIGWKRRLRLFVWQRRRPLLITLSIFLAAVLASRTTPLILAPLPVSGVFLTWLLLGAVFVLALLAFLAD
ncbi:MAG: hypothetical protein AAF640_06615 [Pseudomonadota bacterium]